MPFVGHHLTHWLLHVLEHWLDYDPGRRLILFSLGLWLLLLTVPLLLVLQLWFDALDVFLVVLLVLKLFGTFGGH